MPPNLLRRYLAVWAVNAVVAGFWALSIFIADPRHPIIEVMVNLGRLSWAVTMIAEFAVGLNLAGHIASLKFRRWFGSRRRPLVGPPKWDVLVNLGLVACGFYAFSLGVAVLIAGVGMIEFNVP